MSTDGNDNGGEIHNDLDDVRNVSGEVYDPDTGEFICKAPDVLRPTVMAEPDAYAGISSGPFPKSITDILCAPVDPADVDVKQGDIVFLPADWFRARLTKAFGVGGWALKPSHAPAAVTGKNGTVTMCYSARLYCHGRFVDESWGSAPIIGTMGHSEAIETARTKTVTRACKMGLSMAPELWNKKWRDTYMANRRLAMATQGPPTEVPKHPTPQPAQPALRAVPKPAAKKAAAVKDNAGVLRANLKNAGWQPKHVKNWLNKLFGVGHTTELNDTNIVTALRMLFVRLNNEPDYQRTLVKAEKDGLVMAGASKAS